MFHVNHLPVFYLRDYSGYTKHVMEKLGGSQVSFFLGSNMHWMPLSAKVISSGVKKISNTVKAHVAGYSFRSCSFGS